MKPDPSDPAFLGALVYFEQAAEKLSFVEAAEALNVTPSAVSHRITSLEQALGQRLFRREVRRVHLTAEGTELANVARDIIDRVRVVTERLVNRPVLHVYVGPYLSAMWLMGRLKEFETLHPGLRIDLIHNSRTAARDVDVAILWQDAAQCPKGHQTMFNMLTVPVAAPGTVGEESFWESSVDPIHYQDRHAWRHWLAENGAPADYAERGEIFQDPSLVFQSAAHGRGIAIGFLPFISDLIGNNKLVTVNKQSAPALRVYRITVNNKTHPFASAFVDWVMERAQCESLEG